MVWLATLVPVMVAAGVLVYLLQTIADATEHLKAAQADHDQIVAERDAAKRELAEFEKKQAQVLDQTKNLRVEHDELHASKEQLIQEIQSLRGDKERCVAQTELYEEDRAMVRKQLKALAASPELGSGRPPPPGQINRPGADRELSSKIPITAVAEPRASADKVPGRDKVYRFRAWVDLPKARLRDVKSVTYVFNHPSFKKKRFVSKDRSDGFAVEYTGWGALTNVTLEFALADGTSHKMAFNMLAALGWK